MNKPKILVTSAAGRTGTTAVLELLKKNFPVRAFVRNRDSRAAALEKAGAEIFVGDLFDFYDVSKAMIGVQRAYHCPPFAPNLLEGVMVFALAAEEAKLEVVALMSGWNDNSEHPSIVTREHWIAKQLYRWMPSVDVIHINPGLFAFTYLLGLPSIVHFGMFMAPFGEGRNAPPSNEDIARVAIGTLIDPKQHIGKSYRPTGPKLLSPYDVATILGKILNRKVKYKNISMDMFAKAAKALGASTFEIAQLRYYSEELRNGVYEIGAPTDHVALVTKQEPEDFEQIAKRYIKNPSVIHPKLKLGNKLSTFAFLARMILAHVPNLERWERERGYPILKQPLLAHQNKDWVATAQKQQANLLHPNPI